MFRRRGYDGTSRKRPHLKASRRLCGRHRRVDVPHRCVHGDLIATATRNGLHGLAKVLEPTRPVDLQFIEESPKPTRKRVDRDVLAGTRL